MHRLRMVVIPAVLSMSALAAAAVVAAQPAPQTGTDFYMKYRAAFDKAKSFDEIKPYMSASSIKEIESHSADDRKKMFGFIKMLATYTDVKVVKEEKTATGAVITAEGIDPSDKKKAKGTITLIKENGAWKLDKEEWAS